MGASTPPWTKEATSSAAASKRFGGHGDFDIRAQQPRSGGAIIGQRGPVIASPLILASSRRHAHPCPERMITNEHTDIQVDLSQLLLASKSLEMLFEPLARRGKRG